MTPQEIVLNHVCPSLGVLIAVITFASPLPAILEADRTKKLKSMNPLPLVAMAANTTLGCIYGQITHDWYIYVGNMIGMMLSWFYISTSYKFLGSKEQDRVLKVMLTAASVVVVLGSINLFQVADKQKLWGSAAVAVLGIYYVAPLTSLVTVLKERDSSSIYWPLSLANLVNGVLWFVYGMARNDWFFVAMPNAMGVAFNAVSLMLCVVLPARDRQKEDRPGMLNRLLQSFRGKSRTEATPTELSDQPSVDLELETASQHSHK